MPRLNPEHLNSLIRISNQSPYYRLLSMRIRELGVGFSIVEIEIDQKHLNPFGGLHGGVYASLIDTAAYWAVYCELDEKVGYISVDLKVDFLAPTEKGRLVVKGQRIKIGKTICLAEATALDQNDRCLAHGVSKMMVTPGLQTMEDSLKFMGGKDIPPKFL
ncbi:MAG: PaaI family thioesterase [Deltaproteobacteria bacterium]|nr:PaaI family thioesterase [Deltaproteobacteria bacterium]